MMLLIRLFEEALEEMLSRGLLHGTMHLSIGQAPDTHNPDALTLRRSRMAPPIRPPPIRRHPTHNPTRLRSKATPTALPLRMLHSLQNGQKSCTEV